MIAVEIGRSCRLADAKLRLTACVGGGLAAARSNMVGAGPLAHPTSANASALTAANVTHFEIPTP